MSVSILFEVQTTPDEPLHELLSEIDALPHISQTGETIHWWEVSTDD